MTVCGLELSPCPRVCVICGWWEEFRHARQSRSTHQLEQYAQATDRASECQAINNCARSYEGERSFLYSVKPSQMRWCCSVPYEGAVLHKGPYEALVRRKAARRIQDRRRLSQKPMRWVARSVTDRRCWPKFMVLSNVTPKSLRVVTSSTATPPNRKGAIGRG